jgi:hypothetical protein
MQPRGIRYVGKNNLRQNTSELMATTDKVTTTKKFSSETPPKPRNQILIQEETYT